MTKVAWTVRGLSERLGIPFTGDGDRPVARAMPADLAGPGDLAFIEKFDASTRVPDAACVVVPPGAPELGIPTLRAPIPRAAFFQAVSLLYPARRPAAGIHPTAVVAPDASVDASASVGPHAVVESGASVGPGSVVSALGYVGFDSRIGRDCMLHPRVVLYDGVTIGNRVILHAGVVVGSDGFGYFPFNGRHVKIPQVGGVRIGDDVEIGANACIDRATLAETVIGDGTKIDNLVQIAHNVQLGSHVILAAQVGIAGSTKVGDGSMLLGQSGVRDHVTLGPGVIVGAQSGVGEDAPAGARLFGSPAKDHMLHKRELAALARLPDLLREIRGLLRGRSGN